MGLFFSCSSSTNVSVNLTQVNLCLFLPGRLPDTKLRCVGPVELLLIPGNMRPASTVSDKHGWKFTSVTLLTFCSVVE